jgi:hypothetical protein
VFIFNDKVQNYNEASLGYAISFPFPLLHFHCIISLLLLSLQQHLLFTPHLLPADSSVSRPLARRQQDNKHPPPPARAIKYKELRQGVRKAPLPTLLSAAIAGFYFRTA